MSTTFVTPIHLAKFKSKRSRCPQNFRGTKIKKLRVNDVRASLDYASAGVDIDMEGSSVRALLNALGTARAPRQPGSIGSPVSHGGGFSGLIQFGSDLLGLCTDGVGSKMALAEDLGVYDTVGIDCMAMNVNDLLCVGCEPLAFVDYIAASEPNPKVWAALGRGLAVACRDANVTLAGGETATLPSLVNGVDLSGTALGTVPAGFQIDGARVRVGDAVIGLPSSGLHSNGYTLARAILEKSGANLEDALPFEISEMDKSRLWRQDRTKAHTLGSALLTPTAIYVNPLVRLFLTMRDSGTPGPYEALHGLAHITGGGLSNLLRLRDGIGFHISEPLPVHPEYKWLQTAGGITDLEMYKVFNMGMGMCIIVAAEHALPIAEWLDERYPGTRIVGEVTNNAKVTHALKGVEFLSY